MSSNSTALQHTLKTDFMLRGVGLHTGAIVMARVWPEEPNKGRAFRVGSIRIPADARYVVDTRRCTTLGHQGACVRTVEHLLSALHALGVDNALIEVEGPELPILDGSALPWVQAIQSVGLKAQSVEAPTFSLPSPIHLGEDNCKATATPAPSLHIGVEFLSEEWHEGCAQLSVPLSSHALSFYTQSVAPARTFAFQKEVQALLDAGLARGGSLENALIITPPNCFSSPLRVEYEWVAHKLLDLIGDLALVGARFCGHVFVRRPGHSINTNLARAIQQALAVPTKGDNPA